MNLSALEGGQTRELPVAGWLVGKREKITNKKDFN